MLLGSALLKLVSSIPRFHALPVLETPGRMIHVCSSQGRPREAELTLLGTLGAVTAKQPDDHGRQIRLMRQLIMVYDASGRDKEGTR